MLTCFHNEEKVLECNLDDDVTYERPPIAVISSGVRTKRILNVDFEELPTILNVNLQK